MVRIQEISRFRFLCALFLLARLPFWVSSPPTFRESCRTQSGAGVAKAQFNW